MMAKACAKSALRCSPNGHRPNVNGAAPASFGDRPRLRTATFASVAYWATTTTAEYWATASGSTTTRTSLACYRLEQSRGAWVQYRYVHFLHDADASLSFCRTPILPYPQPPPSPYAQVFLHVKHHGGGDIFQHMWEDARARGFLGVAFMVAQLIHGTSDTNVHL